MLRCSYRLLVAHHGGVGGLDQHVSRSRYQNGTCRLDRGLEQSREVWHVLQGFVANVELKSRESRRGGSINRRQAPARVTGCTWTHCWWSGGQPPPPDGAVSRFPLRRADQELVDGHAPRTRHAVGDGIGNILRGEELHASQA